MIAFLRTLLIATLMATLLPGCAMLHGVFKKKKPHKEEAQEQHGESKPKELIGTVTLVNSDVAYALIDNGSQPSPAPGTKVECRAADGSTAQLRVTEIRKRPFIVADIISGTPHKGDEVYQVTSNPSGTSNQ